MTRHNDTLEQVDLYVPSLVAGARVRLLAEGSEPDAVAGARRVRPSLVRQCEDGLWRAWALLGNASRHSRPY